MINERFFLKFPEEFQKGILVYPPSVNEVVGNKEFNSYRQLLLISQEDIEDRYIEKHREDEYIPTPFEFLLSSAYSDERILQLIKRAFYFFIKEDVTILVEQKIILVGNLQENLDKLKELQDINKLKIINEENYFAFQNLLRQSLGEKELEPPNPNEHPKIKKMKAKARYRDRIKAKQNGITLGVTLASICCMRIGLTPLNIGEISYAAISPLMRYCQEQEKYNIDIQSLLAGAKKKDVDLKYWIRNLDD